MAISAPGGNTLLVRDYDRYRAAYCGLCRALGKRCGFAARFWSAIDMTFLYLLLRAPEKAGESRNAIALPMWPAVAASSAAMR